MTRSRYRLVALTLATAAIATIAVGATAGAASANTTHTPPSTAQGAAPTFTDTDVATYFAGGRGHLAAYLSDANSGSPTTGIAGRADPALTQAYLAMPGFHDSVSVPLQSGDPYRTLQAINTLREGTPAPAGPSDGTDKRCIVVFGAVKLFFLTDTKAPQDHAVLAADIAAAFAQ